MRTLAIALLALLSAVPLRAKPPPAIAELHAADREVGLIGARLAAAARDLCKVRVGAIGVVLDDAARYAPAWRVAAARLLGSATAPTIVALVAGGAADRAGVHVGDAIVAVDGWAVPTGDSDRSEAVLDRLEQTSQPLVLHIRRGGVPLSFRMTPGWSCRTRFQVLPGGGVQATANGARVEIGSELVRVAQGEDELAVVLAHELAHNILDHRARLAAAGGFGTRPASARATRLTHATEKEADRLAVYLSDRAGFGLDAYGSLWRRLGRGGGALHPPNAERAALLAKDVARVRAARAAGRTPRPDGLDAYLRSAD